MLNQRGSFVLGLVAILAIVYFFLFYLSLGGWGYAGYHHRTAYTPSFWYWGGPNYYAGPSVRAGSTGGPGHVGGGPRAGK